MASYRLLVAFIFVLSAFSQPADRITRPVDDRSTVTRPGNRHPLARAEYDRGIATPSHRMDRMMLVLEADPVQRQALEALLRAQQDPQSPQYHRWLTPETFGNMFGVSDRDLNQVVSWLIWHGFEVEPVSGARSTLTFSGTAAQVESAFHTQIHIYNVNGERHFANSSDPEIPRALAGVVHGVASLHDFQSMPLHVDSTPAPQYSSGATHYMAPADFATIYDVAALYSGSIDGSGQSIAVVGRSNFTASDVTKFRTMFGLPPSNTTVVLNGPNPGIVSSGEQTEAELDVEWAGAVGKNAAVQFVLSGSTNTTDGVLLSSQYIVNNNLAPVMSLSFGLCEAAMGNSQNQVWNSLWQQAAAQGITVLVSSGDSGAAGCDGPSATNASHGAGVNGLCSSPYSTCIGGTQFADTSNASLYWSPTTNPQTYGSALSYIPEAVWNGSALTTGGSGLWSGGGGASIIYPKPSWQAGAGVPADGHRDVPDVSLTASLHDAYLFCLGGQLYLVGGTSASTPAFAGIMAMVVQHTGSRQGNINPTLYGLATKQGSGGAAVFHDTTAGNNSVPGVTGFSAGPGYDLSTGLGSVDAFVLVNHWSDTTAPATPALQLTASQPSLTFAPGTSATVQVTVASNGGFNSTVSLSTGALPAGLTASFSPSGFPAPGAGSSILTLSAAANLAPAAYNLSLIAAGGGITQTIPLSATVRSNCTYSINPTSAAPAAAGGNFSATVTATSGCTWSASSTVNWIGITAGTSGTGTGLVVYSVAANTAAALRSGSLSIAGLTFPVTQAAAGAAPSGPPLSPPSAAFASSGGPGSITVTLPNKAWIAASQVSWITVKAGSSSNGGNKTVNYSVAANSGASRTGNILIGGLTFTVTQAGSSCAYKVTLGTMTSAPGGFNGSAIVSTASACTWTASSNVTWINLTTPSQVTGPATARFFVAKNPNASSRTGVLTIAGYSIQVTEATKNSVKVGKPVR